MSTSSDCPMKAEPFNPESFSDHIAALAAASHARDAILGEIRDYLADIARAARVAEDRLNGSETEVDAARNQAWRDLGLTPPSRERLDLIAQGADSVSDLFGQGREVFQKTHFQSLGCVGRASDVTSTLLEQLGALFKRDDLRFDLRVSLGHESSNSSVAGAPKVGRGGGDVPAATPGETA